MKYTFSSESVTEGHPDKICDKISDAILDACLEQDIYSKVACETAAKNNMIFVFGEITTKAIIDVEKIVRKTIKEIGYFNYEPFNHENIFVFSALTKQSPNIAQGILKEDQGAGDQGIMFGYATNETKELMPAPILYAHRLTQKLAEVRKNLEIDYLLPDGKSQVAFEYIDGKPKRIESVVIASHHKPIKIETLRKDIIEKVIKPICKEYIDENTKFYINETGLFEIGGPIADAGITGRKIIVDTYGGAGKHGGGCFSGKDPSKVDRSAAYMCRYIAKNIVASGLAEKAEVQVGYCIGVSEPLSVHVETYGTGKISDEKMDEIIRKEFPLKPAHIIKHLNLLQPIYKETAAYGHFGRNGFPWENTDKANDLKKYLP